jgi:hypothetical protein
MIKTKKTKKNTKNTKNTSQTQKIISALSGAVNDTKDLYRTNKFHVKKKNKNKNKKFISLILDECISEILENLEDVKFTLKYEIYGELELQPSSSFHKKEDLKEYMFFLKKKFDDYENDTFGIRLEFIDPDANRYIYIITIE